MLAQQSDSRAGLLTIDPQVELWPMMRHLIKQRGFSTSVINIWRLEFRIITWWLDPNYLQSLAERRLSSTEYQLLVLRWNLHLPGKHKQPAWNQLAQSYSMTVVETKQLVRQAEKKMAYILTAILEEDCDMLLDQSSTDHMAYNSEPEWWQLKPIQ